MEAGYRRTPWFPRFALLVGVFAVLLSTGMGSALAQTPSPSPTGLDPAVVRADLGDWGFWLTLLVAMVFGALGGVVYELLILQGNIELPHKPTEEEFADRPAHASVGHLLDLGIWARVVIGSLAALAALLVISPASTLRLVATSIVAGSAGTAVFRSVQDRLMAALAQKDAAETREKARKQTEKIAEAKRALALARGAPGGPPEAESFGVGAGGPAESLARVEALLAEAEGIGQAL